MTEKLIAAKFYRKILLQTLTYVPFFRINSIFILQIQLRSSTMIIYINIYKDLNIKIYMWWCPRSTMLLLIATSKLTAFPRWAVDCSTLFPAMLRGEVLLSSLFIFRVFVHSLIWSSIVTLVGRDVISWVHIYINVVSSINFGY